MLEKLAGAWPLPNAARTGLLAMLYALRQDERDSPDADGDRP